jgi:hypothetical protein
MSKPLVLSTLARFTAKTAGRDMTRAAYAAVAAGVAAMVVLTVAPAYEVAHHWVDAVLWACLVYFVFEWLVRLRHMARQGWLSLYALSGSGVVDAIGALAVPAALLSGIEPPGRRGCSASSGCSRSFRASRGCGSCVDFRLLMARHPDLAETIDAEARRRAQENK